MRRIRKYGAILMITMMTIICGVSAEAAIKSAGTEDCKQHQPHVKVNDRIVGEEGELVVTEVGDDYYIASPVQQKMAAASKCPHNAFMDTGKPSIVYRQYSNTKHEQSKQQRMVCRRCKKYYSFRYYDFKYLAHFYNKNNVCYNCYYTKK